MHKLPIIIINGKGGCGKDSLIDGIVSYGWWRRTLSAVDKVKQAATVLGWDGGKEDNDRKFLHELKNLSTDYNDGPNTYLCNTALSILKWCLPVKAKMVDKFPQISEEMLTPPRGADFHGNSWANEFFEHGAIFMHCREPENIEALRLRLNNLIIAFGLDTYVTVATVIVSRKDTDAHVYGNHCDDDVYDYIYDYYIDNNGTLDDGTVGLSEVLHQIAGDQY